MPDVEAPANYSVILSGGGRNKKIEQVSLLYRSSTAVVRARSRARVLHGLFSYLSTHIAPPEGLHTSALAAIADGKAVLLPGFLRASLKTLQPHLRRAGWRLADVPYCTLDVDEAEIIVPEPTLTIDYSVVEELESKDAGARELPRVVPGRYPIHGWACSVDASEGELSRAMAVAATLGAVEDPGTGVASAVQDLARLFSTVKAVPAPAAETRQMVADLQAALRI